MGTPLTFEITSSGAIVWKANSTAYTITLEYSKDSGQNWTQITSTTGGASISVSVGDTVQFRCGTDSGYNTIASGDSYYNNCSSFSGTTCGFKVKGNVMSLLNRNFASLDTLQSANTFYNLFQRCTGLTDASELVLPATTLAVRCYSSMFNSCTSLTTAPSILPATTLDYQSYYAMFTSCSSLTSAPELPATTLANNCYQSMFYGCTNLTTAPKLPATALTEQCYYQMFDNCTNLATAPELPATKLGRYCYEYMFRNCSHLTTAQSVLPATALTQQCYYEMFRGCTSLTTAPELPATTLASDSYYQMFYGCTSLNYIKCLATTTNTLYIGSWVYGVASTGTFVKNPSMTSWTTGASGIPTGWTVQDA